MTRYAAQRQVWSASAPATPMYNVPTPVASSRVHKHPSPPPFSFTPSHTPPPSLPSMSPPRSFAPLPLPPAPHSALKSQIVRNAQSHNYARARVHAHQQPHLGPRPHTPSEAADIPPRPHLHPRPHPHPSHPAAQVRARALQCRLEAAHAALLADLEVIGDDEARRRLRIEAHNDLVYRWSWEWEVNPGPGGGLGGGARL